MSDIIDSALKKELPRRRSGGRVVYAIGDIHGRCDLLRNVLEVIRADIRSLASSKLPVLVTLGDYVDRGPLSRETLDLLVDLGTQGEFELRTLLGNHEEAMLDFLDRKTLGSGWLKHGGGPTMLSYGVAPPRRDADRTEFNVARRQLLEAIPSSHITLLRNLELHVTYGDYLFVHAGVRPDVELAFQSPRDLLWIRRGFLDWNGDYGKTVVHGHTPMDNPHVGRNRIGIDTGAYLSGILTAVRIDERGPAVLSSLTAGAHRSFRDGGGGA